MWKLNLNLLHSTLNLNFWLNLWRFIELGHLYFPNLIIVIENIILQRNKLTNKVVFIKLDINNQEKIEIFTKIDTCFSFPTNQTI